MIKWWLIKCSDESKLFTTWLNKGIVSVGWNEIGNPKDYETKDRLLIKCDEVYSNEVPIYRIQTESQLWKFSREINIDDVIVTYREENEEYYFGIVEKTHEYIPEVLIGEPNVIKVKWLDKTISENLISTEIKNYLNFSSTVSQIVQYEKEIQGLVGNLISENNKTIEQNTGINIIKEIYKCNNKLVRDMEKPQLIQVLAEVLKKLEYNIENIKEDDFLYNMSICFDDPLKIFSITTKIIVLKLNKAAQYKDIENIVNENYSGKKIIIVSTEGFAASVRDNLEEDKAQLISSENVVKLIFENYDSFSNDVKNMLCLQKVFI